MLPQPFNIEGKTVIITGAARGIGKGIIQVLAEAGAKVLVTALTERYLQPLAEEMAAAGHPVDILQADATRTEDWERTVQVALERWGQIDVLINNLGDAIRKPLVPLPTPLNPPSTGSGHSPATGRGRNNKPWKS